MKTEIQSKTGVLFDPTRIPIPKHRIGDEIYTVDYDGHNVRLMEVVEINYNITWFDNNYTARFTCNLTYQVTNQEYRGDNVVETDMFTSLEEATKESIKRKSAAKIKRIEDLQQSKLEAENTVKRLTSALEIALK